MTLSYSHATNATYDYGRFMETVLVYFSLNQPRKALLYMSLTTLMVLLLMLGCTSTFYGISFQMRYWMRQYHLYRYSLMFPPLSLCVQTRPCPLARYFFCNRGRPCQFTQPKKTWLVKRKISLFRLGSD